jgi:galactonate dehydratase
MTRREAILGIGGLAGFGPLRGAESSLKITGMDFFAVKASNRTQWLFVRLKTNKGLTGLGECSDGWGPVKAPQLGAIETLVAEFFELTRDQSPFAVEAYRQKGRPLAKAGKVPAHTAFSAIEQAHWDLVGKALGAPVYELFGGKIRDRLPIYANINRITTERTPEAFAANARKAIAEGYGSVKAAPWDGYPQSVSLELGIACVEAIRKAIGAGNQLFIDCHSHFDVKLGIDVAKRLEPQNVVWYEEPIAPTLTKETIEIHSTIKQPMAGGEMLFGMEGFAPLCKARGIDIIMPDVKHCGGLLEGRKISAMAELEEIQVAPHNPTGPVATAASVQWCAGLPNFKILEYQWGEVPWRGDLVSPPQTFERGTIAVPSAPGFGIELNDRVVKEHLL